MGRRWSVNTKVVALQFSRCAGALVRNAADAREPACQQIVGRALDRPCRRGIGRSAMWRTLLEATVSRRVARRRDDDPVGQPARPRPLVAKDGMRDERRWCKTLVGIDHRFHAAGDQHLDHRGQRGSRQCVRVDTDEQRAVDARVRRSVKIACAIARMCASLKALSKAGPR